MRIAPLNHRAKLARKLIRCLSRLSTYILSSNGFLEFGIADLLMVVVLTIEEEIVAKSCSLLLKHSSSQSHRSNHISPLIYRLSLPRQSLHHKNTAEHIPTSSWNSCHMGISFAIDQDNLVSFQESQGKI